ncbi:hypothetical protein GCM10010106_41070 [Thermopolyspora flexuosa]|nr:DUF4265 domain-containing protein [Thermopolyspora flexuosa]PZN41523.1 MAG: hypothetical protein DIU60_16885 [Actinomycetota bacterium]GGM89437.1 hypothetical protein GCM10010106_41070 [Thermopolyspora flexuosa]
MSEGTHEVRCIPFIVYGVALLDLVKLDPDGRLVEEVIRPSGRRVMRMLSIPSAMETDLKEELNSLLRNGNLLHEWNGDRNAAIDVPPGANGDEVVRLAAEAERKELAYWEWADVKPFAFEYIDLRKPEPEGG